MARSTSSHAKRTSPHSVKPLDIPLELRCGACGRKGSYSVGRLFLDPTMTAKGQMWLNQAFGFTGYVRCVHCNAGGPWELTQSSTATLLVLMQESLSSPKDARIHSAQTTLFDGTMTRWATQGEAHLKQLIEKDPDNYYLWSRLGNLYMAAEVPDLALEAFREAIKRNEHDVESLHSLAIILHDRHEDEAAAHHYQQALLHARHAPEKTSRDMLRNVIGHSMEMLSELNVKSGGRIPLVPEGASLPQPMKKNKSDTPRSIVTEFDLSDEDDLDRLVDFWSTGKLPESVTTPASKPRPVTDWTPNWARRESQSVGRNDPCPCGSGKKFKNCCMRT